MKALKFKITLLICVFLVFFACYITFIERNMLIATHKEIDLSGRQSVKIVQFTDTHIGDYFSLEQLEKVANKINEQNADIVVFTGDLFDIAREHSATEDVVSILGKIKAPLGKLAIFGNRDYGGGGSHIYAQLMEDAGFKVLVNESITMTTNSKTLSIYGADDYIFGYSDVHSLMSNINESHVNILLTHEPDAVLEYTDYPIDLALSGHSHGGQIRLPFYGEVIKTNYCDSFSKGLYSLENARKTQVFVSSGIGNTKVPFRLGNIPEIIVFDLKI